MLSRKDWGGGSGDDRFTDELSQLKRQGASVLVVGSVRTEQRRDVSRRLLGQATSQPRRRVLVSTTGATHTHLAEDETESSETLTRVNYATQARSATSETAASETASSGPGPISPSADESPVTTTTLADLGIAISSAIEGFETEADGLAPAELRVGVDSLVPLIEEYGAERVFKFVHLTNGRTRDTDGMIHYHLPMDRNSDVVSVLTPLFDIVIELREQNGTFQERWSINDGDLSSGWISISQS
ncbi:DUF7504 family protein [Haloterrigena alkaliphila]|uniref:Uncharacterized protein n=1 Tax=Haloterrigena alkaliphila TaxID=2816475 RepID=A0A8A2VFQ9_9EURY|nr:hypothetical protein [Haloterrigena alkaliphila]QSX00954.1 hypothetical protein J0X25_08350 [Haloterrigena alkaliphila]